ncbi:MAG: hypothetical protein WBC76_12850 [Actinomycetes bacterium]
MPSKSRSLKGPILGVTCALAVSSAGIGVITSSLSQAEPVSRTVRLVAEHDSFTTSTRPTVSRDHGDRLVARNTVGVEKVSYLSFTVTRDDLGQGPVLGAKLLLKPYERLRVQTSLRLVNNAAVVGRTLTHRNAPEIGKVVGTAKSGPATTRWVDVSFVVKGPGTYSFALTTDKRKSRFFSSETPNPPMLLVRMGNEVPAAEPGASESDTPTPDESKTTPKPSSSPAPDPVNTDKPSPTPASGTDRDCVERFAGDPCAGSLYYGASVEGGDPRPLESEVGTGLTLFRSYMQPSTPASKFASRASADVAAGRIPLISTKVPGSWADVANGKQDPWLLDRIKALAAVQGPVWLVLHHEPRGDGDPADWVRMQQHTRTLIDQHADNIALVGILNGWDFLQKNGNPGAYNHPVGTGVHVMGFDSYNPWSPTNGDAWKSPEKTLLPADTIQSWGYPTLVGEYGVRTDPQQPGRAADWMKDVYTIALQKGFVGLSYFDSGANSPDGTWDLTGERLDQFARNLKRTETAHQGT